MTSEPFTDGGALAAAGSYNDAGALYDKTAAPPSAVQPVIKRGLTSRRPRRDTDSDEYAGFTRRVLRDWGRRVAAGDIDAIAGMAAAAAELDAAIRQAVEGLRARELQLDRHRHTGWHHPPGGAATLGLTHPRPTGARPLTPWQSGRQPTDYAK